MGIDDVIKKAKFICKHKDSNGVPISCYYDELEDMYYITYDVKVTSDKKEYVTFKQGSKIKENILFDPFSEIKTILGKSDA